MKVKTPQEFGLPEKFDSWRPVQEEGLTVLNTSTKREIGLCMPTGSGKSPVYVAHALRSGVPTCFVTANRGLQDQLVEDFASIGLVAIKGRRNYSCGMREDYTCEEGRAARCPYKGTPACDSDLAEMRAASSPLVVTNYDKWTAAKKFGQGMEHFQQVIFDEAHEAPNALARSMQVQLNFKEADEHCAIQVPVGAHADSIAEWKVWARRAKLYVEAKLRDALAKVQSTDDPKPSWVKHYTHMRNLSKRVSTIATAQPDSWIVEENDTGYQFDPIWPGRYAESGLFFRIPRIIFMSATIRPKTLFMCGLGRDTFDFFEFQSDFDAKRCPIYYVPTMRVDSKNPDKSLLWIKLDQIAARRRDRKGIVQTVSFTRQDEVMGASRFSSQMLVNLRGEAPTSMIETFKQAGPGSILVSPSVGTGYDFPGQTCEWQFIAKVPFEPPSKILKAREERDKEYRHYNAMQALVQMCGRGMRSAEDRCETFICDTHLDWFMPRYGHLAPKSFHKFFRTVSYLPSPPERLVA